MIYRHLTTDKIIEIRQQFMEDIGSCPINRLPALLEERQRDRSCVNSRVDLSTLYGTGSVSYILSCLETQYLLDRFLASGYDTVGLWQDIECDEELYYVVYYDDMGAFAFYLNTDNYTFQIEFKYLSARDFRNLKQILQEGEDYSSLYDLLISLRTDTQVYYDNLTDYEGVF